MTARTYRDFFTTAFSSEDGLELVPFDYQEHLATCTELPSLIHVPTGAGKTAAIIGTWLWKRITGCSVGRRLIYCLPMRTLVEQTHQVAVKCIKRLESCNYIEKDRFRVAVLMGGDVDASWEAEPEKEYILIGTQDMLLSRALNRGYAMSKFKWPIHFGMLNNDSLWVYDEIQLMSNGLGTTVQLSAFRKKFGTIGPMHSIWMSATLRQEWLDTVDFSSASLKTLTISLKDQESSVLSQRLNAVKRLAKAPLSCRLPAGLAEFARLKHRPGSQTLIVVNTVIRAREVYEHLKKQYKKDQDQPTIKLIHSRFRPYERKGWIEFFNNNLDEHENGRIIVATQVVEAGVDISSELLITDIAPFSSLVQRFGRCNRKGEVANAEVYWVDLPLTSKTDKFETSQIDTLSEDDFNKIALPYTPQNFKTSFALLEQLDSVNPTDLEKVNYHEPYEPDYLLRCRDILDLFDTSSDLSGFDIDISRYVRGTTENDLSVAWRQITDRPDTQTPALHRDELCPVSVSDFKDYLRGKNSRGQKRIAWIWDALEKTWKMLKIEQLRPGISLLLDVNEGGYDVEAGWTGGKDVVSPVDVTFIDADEADEDDPMSYMKYTQTLKSHSMEAKKRAEEILDSLKLNDLDCWKQDLLKAVHYHDLGKAHNVFQATLYGQEQPDYDPLLAKSTRGGKHSRRHFRHELASALALLQMGASDLSVYLAACHHGKIRLSIRAIPGEDKPQDEKGIPIKYARGIWDGDYLPAVDLGFGVNTTEIILDLEPMIIGRSNSQQPSWLERMLGLRDRIGIFRLAYLEALIRAADIRASINPIDILSVGE